MWRVKVTLENGQLFAEAEFDCPGNAAEYALAFREQGFYTDTINSEED